MSRPTLTSLEMDTSVGRPEFKLVLRYCRNSKKSNYVHQKK